MIKCYFISYDVIQIISFKYTHGFTADMKERVTLTLDSEILNQIDHSVDGFHIKNRSHAIELLLIKAMQSDIPQQAIILAAGKEKRLKGLAHFPIGMLPIYNKPIIEHLIELFKKYNVRDILIGVCYDKEKIMDYFGNGSRFGVKIRYLEEDKPSGTTTIVKRAKPFLSGSFFVSNSDEIKDVNLTDMYITHKENNAMATIALTVVEDSKPYGVVKIDGIRIREFREKPKIEGGQNRLINAGLYLLELDVLDMIPEGVTMFYDFFPVLAKQNRLIGYPFSGQWFDISSRNNYEQAQNAWRGI